MSTSRITDPKRCPSAKVYGVAYLDGWELVFNKKTKDGTAAANIKRKDSGKVWGVIFSITEEELPGLHKAEGFKPGDATQFHYDRLKINVKLQGCDTGVDTFAYVSAQDHKNLLPTQSYLQHLIYGATEHALPEEYTAIIKAQKTVHENSREPK